MTTAATLQGRSVLVTRPAHQAGPLLDAVEAAGGRALRFPVIDIVGRDAADIAAEVAGGGRADIVIFISANAVRFGFDAARGDAEVAAIGPATAAAIEAAGGAVTIRPAGGFDSEHLLAHERLADVRGDRVRIVRGGPGRKLLGETLEQRGARVEYVSAYERRPHSASAAELESLERHWRSEGVDFAVVMSVESWSNLLALLPPFCLEALPSTTLVTPSERVIQTASGRMPGIPTILASGTDPDAMIRAMTSPPTHHDRPRAQP